MGAVMVSMGIGTACGAAGGVVGLAAVAGTELLRQQCGGEPDTVARRQFLNRIGCGDASAEHLYHSTAGGAFCGGSSAGALACSGCTGVSVALGVGGAAGCACGAALGVAPIEFESENSRGGDGFPNCDCGGEEAEQ
eukprot:TRINITY_DN70778_c0_g1_i1.p3 TRINITY_DN70778_c0_g1~~TRINITY_DN70778_c0_g1_i1.p3  ORF type:complete len:137 (+),score=33.04 TRINITY_DN70778_c0_g1_i1:145-555(+)